jgi:hypothetical protein
MRTLLVILLLMAKPTDTAAPEDFIGVWKLVSWQVIVDNEPPQNVFGLHPNGYLILTREGRAITLTTAESRKPGMGDAERAELPKSMLAYSGRYRVEGNDFIIRVDVSWNEEWNGTEQRAIFGSTATNCISRRPQRRASCSQARPTSEGSYGKERNRLWRGTIKPCDNFHHGLLGRVLSPCPSASMGSQSRRR